jgi:hypothetical protein
MQLCCPVCATEFPLEAGVADIDAKRLAAALAELEPSLARALFGYLRLHKPAKTALRTARALKLLREVLDLVEAGEVRRDHQVKPATATMWAAGMEHMAATRDKLRLPLSGHGYLAEVVAGLAEQALADAEKRAEEDRRRGPSRRASQPGASDPVADAQAYAHQMVRYGSMSAEQAEQYIERARQRAGGSS